MKLFYAKGELIAWVDLVEELKRQGMKPEDARELIEIGRKEAK